MVLALGLFATIAGLLLGGVYRLTAKPIAEAKERAIVDAIASVTPRFDNSPARDAVELNLQGHSAPLRVYPAFEAGRFVGAAVESYSLDGFSGEIRVMFGFDENGVVTGYQVLSHQETPGLGAKMIDWFRQPGSRRSIIGHDPSVADLRVSKDGGIIDGITAATISSRAFLGSLRLAHQAFMVYRNSQSTHRDER